MKPEGASIEPRTALYGGGIVEQDVFGHFVKSLLDGSPCSTRYTVILSRASSTQVYLKECRPTIWKGLVSFDALEMRGLWVYPIVKLDA